MGDGLKMYPKTRKEEAQRWNERTAYKCAKCSDIIWSRRVGEYVSCKGGHIAVDQTPFYTRFMGGYDDFITVPRPEDG